MMSEQEAIARAKQVVQEQGWPWVEPAQATLRRAWLGRGGTWTIFTNAKGLGTKSRVVLDARTGAVLETGYVPR
jgi:hypothetical protein